MQTKRTRRHLRTRQAILDAARVIIAEEGPAALSMRALADRIDYSAAALYEYFGSKEEIIAAVCAEGQQQLYAAMHAVDPGLPPAEHLHAIGLAYIRFALEHPDYFLLMFTTAPPPNMAAAPAAALEEALHGAGSAYGLLAQAIQRGIDAGLYRMRPGFGPEEIVYAAWAVVHGIAMLRTTAMRHSPQDLAAADEEVLRNFRRGLQAA